MKPDPRLEGMDIRDGVAVKRALPIVGGSAPDPKCTAELVIYSRGARSGVSVCMLGREHTSFTGVAAFHEARFTRTTGDDRVVLFADDGTRYDDETAASGEEHEP